MTKELVQEIIRKANIQDAWETRVFVPTENVVIYVQVGDGSQLTKEDVDADGRRCNGYLDYTISYWNEEGSFFVEGDGGIFAYVVTGVDIDGGELYTRIYDLLVYLYGNLVKEDKFTIQILQ